MLSNKFHFISDELDLYDRARAYNELDSSTLLGVRW